MTDDTVTIGPIEHGPSLCEWQEPCQCWCRACEQHNRGAAGRRHPDDSTFGSDILAALTPPASEPRNVVPHPAHVPEGSRTHVISWSNVGRHCNVPDCEVNRSGGPTLSDGEVETIYAALESVSGYEARSIGGKRRIVEPIYEAVIRARIATARRDAAEREGGDG